MRSWLFAPGDSVKKMTKAAEGDADIVLFDLEDAVVESGKASARAAIAEFLAGKSGCGYGSTRSTANGRRTISRRSCPRGPAGSCCPNRAGAAMSRNSTGR